MKKKKVSSAALKPLAMPAMGVIQSPEKKRDSFSERSGFSRLHFSDKVVNGSLTTMSSPSTTNGGDSLGKSNFEESAAAAAQMPMTIKKVCIEIKKNSNNGKKSCETKLPKPLSSRSRNPAIIYAATTNNSTGTHRGFNPRNRCVKPYIYFKRILNQDIPAPVMNGQEKDTEAHKPSRTERLKILVDN